jgi:hypothetical protein
MQVGPSPIGITTVLGQYYRIREVAFDAVQLNVFLDAYGSQRAVSVMVPAGGSPDPLTVSTSPFISNWPVSCVATAPGTTLLAGPGNGTGIEVVALRQDLTRRAEPRVISILSGRPRAGWNGEHFVVVWWHVDHYRYARVTASGEPLDPEFGRVLRALPPASPDDSNFEMVIRGDQFVIASPGRVTLLRPGAAAETTAIQAGTVEALVARADGPILLVSGVVPPADWFLAHTSGRLSVRTVFP